MQEDVLREYLSQMKQKVFEMIKPFVIKVQNKDIIFEEVERLENSSN